MNNASKILINGGIAVIPTDTLYGIVACASNKDTVEKIYQLKERTPSKPFIILISSSEDLKLFGINLDLQTLEILKKFWPGKVSVILPITEFKKIEKLEYLHRGTNTLAFRIPDKKALLQLLEQTGPLIAPSANKEGEKPAETIEQAKKYFRDSVDIYVDEGYLSGDPSTLIEIQNGNVNILRQGSMKI